MHDWHHWPSSQELGHNAYANKKVSSNKTPPSIIVILVICYLFRNNASHNNVGQNICRRYLKNT